MNATPEVWAAVRGRMVPITTDYPTRCVQCGGAIDWQSRCLYLPPSKGAFRWTRKRCMHLTADYCTTADRHHCD